MIVPSRRKHGNVESERSGRRKDVESGDVGWHADDTHELDHRTLRLCCHFPFDCQDLLPMCQIGFDSPGSLVFSVAKVAAHRLESSYVPRGLRGDGSRDRKRFDERGLAKFGYLDSQFFDECLTGVAVL
jgi:hypothetical protein